MTKSKYKGSVHKTRVNNLKLALALANVEANNVYVLETVIRVFDAVEELKGDFSVRDAARIEAEVEALRKADSKRKMKDNARSNQK